MKKPLYAIYREEKRTNLSQVSRSNKHNLRQQPTPNADPSLPGPSILFGPANLSVALKAKMPAKVRKNAVIAVEAVITASPEFFAHATPGAFDEWVNLSIDWMKQRLGDNLIQVVLHMDELTPHLHAYWIPLKDGRLNYAAIQGTPRHLVDIQTGYATAVASLGLTRGQPNSQRRHAHHSAAANELAKARDAIVDARQSLAELSKHVNTLEGMGALKNTFKALSRGDSPEVKGPAAHEAHGVHGRSRASRRSGLEEVRPKVGLRV